MTAAPAPSLAPVAHDRAVASHVSPSRASDSSWTLHLIDPRAAGDESLFACHLSLARPAVHHVAVLGAGPEAARARSFAIDVHSSIAAPGEPSIARRVSRHLAFLSRTLGAPNAICAWGAACAARAFSRPFFNPSRDADSGPPRIIIETRPPPSGALASRAPDPRAFAGATFVTVGAAATQAWRSLGVQDVRSAPPVFSLPREPASNRAYASPFTAPFNRSDLTPDPDMPVIGLLADPPSHAAPRSLAFIAGLLYAAGFTVAALTPAGASQARQAARFVRDHGRRWTLREWNGSILSMADACDVLVCPTLEFDASLPVGPLLLRAVAAAGKPIVVPDCPSARDLIARGCPLTLAPDASLPALTSRVLTLLQRAASPPVDTPLNTPINADVSPGAPTFTDVIADIIRERIDDARARRTT